MNRHGVLVAAVLALLTPAPNGFGAMAEESAPTVVADAPPPGLRVIGSTIYTLDAKGHTTGTVRETSPGIWRMVNMKGVTVRTIRVSPGCAPFHPCPARRDQPG